MRRLAYQTAIRSEAPSGDWREVTTGGYWAAVSVHWTGRRTERRLVHWTVRATVGPKGVRMAPRSEVRSDELTAVPTEVGWAKGTERRWGSRTAERTVMLKAGLTVPRSEQRWVDGWAPARGHLP